MYKQSCDGKMFTVYERMLIYMNDGLKKNVDLMGGGGGPKLALNHKPARRNTEWSKIQLTG
jgi:hypothetical protein